MTDREKVIEGLQKIIADDWIWKHADYYASLISDALDILKEQEAKPPVHIHEEYPEHDWYRDKNGDIDDYAYDGDYHNGPMCKRCHYGFCIHCDPDGWNKKPCIIDKYECPKCGSYIFKRTKFCSNCGQEVKWDETVQDTETKTL
jgi:hypothetical protein